LRGSLGLRPRNSSADYRLGNAEKQIPFVFLRFQVRSLLFSREFISTTNRKKEKKVKCFFAFPSRPTFLRLEKGFSSRGKLDDLETQKNISRWLPWIPLGRLTLPTARVEDGFFRPCPTPLVGSEDLVVDLFPTHEYVRERR
jgi:hypothetical protein